MCLRMTTDDALRAALRSLLALGVKQQDLADRLRLHRNKLSRFLDGDPSVNIPLGIIDPFHRYLDEIEVALSAASSPQGAAVDGLGASPVDAPNSQGH